MNKEEFDKKWCTCKHCGITKQDIEKQRKEGKYSHNYVMCGCCDVCKEKIQDKEDFEEAQDTGSVTRDDSIMCPYCGYVKESDVYEYNDDTSFECPECGKESELTIEATFHYTTKKEIE